MSNVLNGNNHIKDENLPTFKTGLRGLKIPGRHVSWVRPSANAPQLDTNFYLDVLFVTSTPVLSVTRQVGRGATFKPAATPRRANRVCKVSGPKTERYTHSACTCRMCTDQHVPKVLLTQSSTNTTNSEPRTDRIRAHATLQEDCVGC